MSTHHIHHIPACTITWRNSSSIGRTGILCRKDWFDDLFQGGVPKVINLRRGDLHGRPPWFAWRWCLSLNGPHALHDVSCFDRAFDVADSRRNALASPEFGRKGQPCHAERSEASRPSEPDASLRSA